jgi:hypothetical protein
MLSNSGVLTFRWETWLDSQFVGAAFALEKPCLTLGRLEAGEMAKSWLERLVEQQSKNEGRVMEATDEQLADLVPHVYELLTSRLKLDKKSYEPASLLVFARSGSWHACLSQKSLNLRWWAESLSWASLLPALELVVAKVDGSEEPQNGRQRRPAKDPS